MPFTVQDLIEDNPPPVTAKAGEPVRMALRRMIENDFSQLPVVDAEHRPEGMVTSDSILRALNNFGVSLDDLRVFEAIVKAAKFRTDADLFELLDDMKDNAVLIVDGDDRLQGIVTSYDTTEYFRRRAEDIMLVEDIETTLKDYILAAFTKEEDEVDEDKLARAVQRITESNQTLRSKFERALKHYLNLDAGGEKKSTVQSALVDEVFSRHWEDNRPPKTFEDLTLYEYIELFLSKSCWPRYQSIFNIEPVAIRHLLGRVRQTRNALAHFRSDITPEQRDQLRFCADWLARCQTTIAKRFPLESESFSAEPETITDKEPVGKSTSGITSLEEEFGPNESRYAPLGVWLQSRPAKLKKVQITFEDVEEIIDGELPKLARRHRTWWGNHSESVQAQHWLDAGWRTSYINMSEEKVTFVRMKEREKAYIDFFSSLLDELRQVADFPIADSYPGGTNSQLVTYVPYNGNKVGGLYFSFTRQKQFRIELYLDTGDKSVNKQIFWELDPWKDEIEGDLGSDLSWEQLEQRRASRIAMYFEGSIDDSPEKLAILRMEAVKAMVAFEKAIIKPVTESRDRVCPS